MSFLELRLAAVTDAAANLKAQLCELNELRPKTDTDRPRVIAAAPLAASFQPGSLCVRPVRSKTVRHARSHSRVFKGAGLTFSRCRLFNFPGNRGIPAATMAAP